ncbi:aldehyde dehydrogenase family protein [Colwellia sp. MSW7]|uniref:Aldehyde dehydrogenase family protein n=1 Tax=Colwellia maritima TaxID=2912588 RepID=A0ABS9X5S9_9GAMM|nr:aldehyde dehydrogenase family protein [Colwellia maritima]MCI2285593.1 aldehyde dehydrogenase family protein [Colwellia maritima]
MNHTNQFYINGQWVNPIANTNVDVINLTTERVVAQLAMGNEQDVDAAVSAAKQAFTDYSKTTIEDRIALFERILSVYNTRFDDLAHSITTEMGAPISLSKELQAAVGIAHFSNSLETLKSYKFEEVKGSTLILREPIGVCGLITPWNWPVNQIVCKIAPALAAGCTIVLKPSEVSPLSAIILTEILAEAGVPKGVFNLVHGDGPTVGVALSSHPDVDMMSFTGSTRAGTAVAIAAAPTVKRVAQELGGKSANILLDDVNFEEAVTGGVLTLMMNSGQNCNGPTRMLVPHDKMELVSQIAKAAVETVSCGDPMSEKTTMGPVVNDTQWNKIQGLIQQGVADGATLVGGGEGKPTGCEKGYFVKPTIFTDVTPNMTIAQEEIFGPVLSIIGYTDDEDAISIANNSKYGLSGYVSSADHDRACHVARQIRTGMVHVNGAQFDFTAPFGGYKQSGNGREWGEQGFEEFLETKAIMGYKL